MAMTDGLWVYLATSPLLWLAGTLVVWLAATNIARLSPGSALHNVLWTTLLAAVLATGSWLLVERPALHLKKRFVARAPEASPVAA